VILVPAFVGLGAPHWRAEARGALFGVTRATGPAELARAALQAVAYQTRDLLDAVRQDFPGAAETVLRVDGGMAASDYTMQFLSDVLDAPVDRPAVRETTALGPPGELAACGAGDPRVRRSGLSEPLAFLLRCNIFERCAVAPSSSRRCVHGAGRNCTLVDSGR
jgi:sugar (pentulose or hexulose) kinase